MARPVQADLLAPFYLIIDSLDNLDEFLQAGVRCVQLRIKHMPEAQLRRCLREAQRSCDTHGCALIINDHWALAIEENCRAVHLGQEDLDTADIDVIRQAGLRFGISTHDRTELDRALSYSPDYIALGPIYQTLLKKMPWRPQGLDKLRRWRTRIGEVPLVAIGGLTPERAAGVFAHGADSACVVTDVLQHPAPVERVTQWLQATGRGREATVRDQEPPDQR